jgi:hypothetical protein
MESQQMPICPYAHFNWVSRGCILEILEVMCLARQHFESMSYERDGRADKRRFAGVHRCLEPLIDEKEYSSGKEKEQEQIIR